MYNLQQGVIPQPTCLSTSHDLTELRVICTTAAEQRKSTHYPGGLDPDSPEPVTKSRKLYPERSKSRTSRLCCIYEHRRNLGCDEGGRMTLPPVVILTKNFLAAELKKVNNKILLEWGKGGCVCSNQSFPSF
jgi:hypothetical protein